MPSFPATLNPGRSLSKNDISKMMKTITSLKSRAASAVQKADGVVATSLSAVETTGAAFGLAVLEGRYGPQDIMGVPVSLAAGIAAHAFAFLTDSALDEHAHAIGNGCLACYAVKMGTEIGLGMAAGGSSPVVEGTDSLSDNELNSMAP